MSRGYRLPDEPRPGPWANLVVEPSAPLLAVMMAGCWLAWPWFIVNAWALGSPTRIRETLLALGGFVGNVAFLAGLIVLATALHLDRSIAYLMILLTLWKIGVSYALVALQSRSIGVYRHYGGAVRNGLLLAMAAGFLVRDPLEEHLQAFGEYAVFLQMVLF